MAIIDLKSEDQFNELLSSEDRLFIRFHMKSCGPCKLTKSPVEELSNEFKEVTFVSIDVEGFEQIAAKYAVRGVPFFLSVSGGQPAFTNVGAGSPGQLELLVQRLVDSPLPEVEEEQDEEED